MPPHTCLHEIIPLRNVHFSFVMRCNQHACVLCHALHSACICSLSCSVRRRSRWDSHQRRRQRRLRGRCSGRYICSSHFIIHKLYREDNETYFLLCCTLPLSFEYIALWLNTLLNAKLSVCCQAWLGWRYPQCLLLSSRLCAAMLTERCNAARLMLQSLLGLWWPVVFDNAVLNECVA